MLDAEGTNGTPNASHEHDPTRPFRAKLRADALIGKSAAIAEVLRQAAQIADLEASVLLAGDSGTGKTQLARVLHDSGRRAAGPFVEINCAALPESLFESELFGAAPGAHSTAARKIDGKVAAANGGTLFLDEVGELPLTTQGKLLQFLQSKEYYPLGSTRRMRAHTRVIAATNADLRDAVEQGAFRRDLYYRIRVLSIRLPSLAERRDDLRLLAAHLVSHACVSNQLPLVALTDEALGAIERADWPGNVRQLANALEGAVARATWDGAPVIDRQHLDLDDGPARMEQRAGTRASFRQATRRFQKELVETTLEETGWNVTAAAQALSLTRAHTYNLMRALGIGRPVADPPRGGRGARRIAPFP